jgi:phosphatidylserine decarboxylase
MSHQYIDRRTRQVCDERLYGDLLVRALYSDAFEHAPLLVSAASSRWISNALSILSYNTLMRGKGTGLKRFLRQAGVDLAECVKEPETLDTAKELFERQIRFWSCRPMPDNPAVVVCPVDSRVIVGSLRETSTIFIKEKFFDFAELLNSDRRQWLDAFRNGDFAVFRLTPEKYHYVHVPASGQVADFFEIDGRYHSCNPQATVSLITPYSKNRRVVTILQTDVPDGPHIGLIAIIEVVALMVGQIEQCYSEMHYDFPRPMLAGMFLKRGQPKSLFRPGSSTVILLFQEGRIEFARDLILNRFRKDVKSRFSLGFDQTIVETDVLVRSELASEANCAKGALNG